MLEWYCFMDTELLKGTLSLLIMSLLSRKPMYGYELATTVGLDTHGAFEWKEGSLYPALHKLEKEGLIRDMKRNSFYEKPSEKNRRRRRKAARIASFG